MATLYVVATPIGNLSDVSPSMLEAFQRADLVVAEDTRVTGNLLRHFGISKPITSLHRHNEAAKAQPLVEQMLAEDLTVALASDAGTPAISDPGTVFVQLAASQGIDVLAIAGPSAVTAALSVSGMDARAFAFYGFLPRERSALVKKLVEIAMGPPVAVLYESPHRVLELLSAIRETLPAARASVSRELTKRHEQTIRADISDALRQLEENPNAHRGEYCIVLDMHDVPHTEDENETPLSLEAQIFDLLLQGNGLREASDCLLAKGARKNDVKRAAIAVRKYLEMR